MSIMIFCVYNIIIYYIIQQQLINLVHFQRCFELYDRVGFIKLIKVCSDRVYCYGSNSGDYYLTIFIRVSPVNRMLLLLNYTYCSGLSAFCAIFRTWFLTSLYYLFFTGRQRSLCLDPAWSAKVSVVCNFFSCYINDGLNEKKKKLF